MLDLSSSVWAELRHAYGSASDIPNLLAELYDAPSQPTWLLQDWEAEPLASLGNALVHQGDVYPASYAALPHLVAIAAKQPSPNRIICLNLVGCIAMGQQENGSPEIPNLLQESYLAALNEAAEIILECLHVDWPDDDYKVLLSALVAVRGHGSFAKAILLS
ncbi:MAG TPA: hypothetical protein VFT66_07465 [Roseiflexaceae bacterium]|jgi:hypothetical protein|nr:hypothetical protein [Roseiflexaceae bacterium]